MKRFRTPLLYLLSLNLCGAGFMHLLSPDFFVAIIPEGLPSPEWLNLISGLAEIVLGIYLLEPRTRVFAAWGTIALAVAVFPANVNMFLENIGPEGPGSGSPLANVIRLPFQAVFVLWAWWYTRPDPA
ncbi:MAG: DoxX family protein [Myxococcota bacterium]|nr:DoxX family protein [Myxococcales bacterium]